MRSIEYNSYKNLVGPCFVSFSLPLLIPGVTLTVVGFYGNEKLFPLYGGWHIAGIVILIFAVILLFVGIVLKCWFKPILGADIEEHLSPYPSMITGHRNLGYKDDHIYQGSKFNNKVGHYDKAHSIASTHGKNEKSDKIKNSKDTFGTNGKQSTPKESNVNSNTAHVSTSEHASSNNTSRKYSSRTEDRRTSRKQPEVSNVSYSLTRSSRKNKDERLYSNDVADGNTSVTDVRRTVGVITSVTPTQNNNSVGDTAGIFSLTNERGHEKRKKKKHRRSSQMSMTDSARRGFVSQQMVPSRGELPGYVVRIDHCKNKTQMT